MTPTHFLFRAIMGKTVAPGDRTCCLCGCPCQEVVPVASVIRDTFTNHGLCRAPHSQDVCLACGHYFNHRWLPPGFKKPAEYRLLSMIVTANRFAPWKRERMRPDLEAFLADGAPECVLVVSLSKKKHCLPLAVVNPAGRSFVVQVEEERVRLDAAAYRPLIAAFDGLLALGCRKGEVLSGEYHHQTLRKAGATVGRLLSLDRIVRPHRPSGLLTLLSYITLTEAAGGSADAALAGAAGD